MLVADGEDTGRNRCRERLPVARRGETSRGARGCARAVVRDADQDGVQQPAFRRRRQPIVMQQKIRSVNVECRISSRTSCPRTLM
jgi:hypothetical protein